MRQLFFALLLGMTFGSIHAQFLKDKSPTSYHGLFDFHYVDSDGSIYLEVPTSFIGEEFLYVHSLRTGLGSNDIGIDRGQLGGSAVVKFIKSGKKLLLVQPNLKYRANTENSLERKSVEEAFARSVLYGFTIEDTQDGKMLVNLTSFLMEDRHGVAETLKNSKQGDYKIDPSRSTLWLERTKAFPKNVEFEALLTLKGQPTGNNIRGVAPNPESISVIQHHSFVELPDSNYEPRVFDPRCGSYPLSYLDYATPISEPIIKRFITRHRLEKIDPSASISEAKEPIVYYLDPGTPEPIRSALMEGAQWWNQAFEAIGYKDAFQVKMLPEDADPLDLRYNVIQWVHRSTRGWSYGVTITDPRTGEILKGHVSLGSLRIRQDYMIAQALMNQPFAKNSSNNAMLELALARIRQLAAHEVGHTLGFAHNFAASTNNRASVMDYPHPKLDLVGNTIDFSQAYDTGIGEWDKVAVAYSYGHAPMGVDEEIYLNKILEEAFNSGLRYITDSDSRAKGGAHVHAHLWDNGKNPSEALESLLKIRQVAIQNFSSDNIPDNTPYTVLEDVFVPLYFLHRYQTEATVKLIGGMDYEYAVKSKSESTHNFIPKALQQEALQAVLKTLDPKELAIPEDKLSLFPPRAFGYSRSRESLKSKMGVSFDALGTVATASRMTLELLLHPERANRLVQQQSLQPYNLDLANVFDAISNYVLDMEVTSAYEQEVLRMIQYETLQQLFVLASHTNALPQVKGICLQTIDEFADAFKKDKSAFAVQLNEEIKQFKRNPEKYKKTSVPAIPDGSPIGSFQCSMGG